MMTATILIKKMMTTKRKQWWHLQSVCADLNNLDLAAKLVHPSHLDHHNDHNDDKINDNDHYDHNRSLCTHHIIMIAMMMMVVLMMMITLRMNMRQTMITMIAVNEDDEGEDDFRQMTQTDQKDMISMTIMPS